MIRRCRRPGPPPKWGEPLVHVTNRWPEGLKAHMERLASEDGRSLSDLVVLAVATTYGYPLAENPYEGRADTTEQLTLKVEEGAAA